MLWLQWASVGDRNAQTEGCTRKVTPPHLRLRAAPGSGTSAAGYGLNTLSNSQPGKETANLRALIVAPDDAIGDRKSATAGLNSKVRELLAAFASIDRLIVQYKKTLAGDAFVAAYFAARTIYDRGHSPGEDEPAPTPTPPTP